MSGLRLVLVTRRYWPLVGESEMALANLAHGLLQQGVAPVVLTARFDPHWPSDVTHREVAVHRLPFPQRFAWGTMRYMIALSRWLRRNRPDIDLVCVSRLSQEAHVAISALAGSGVPVVLRAEADGAAESPRSSGAAGISHRVTRSCGTAHAVVAACGGVERAVIEAGFHAARVRLIPNGVAPAPDRSATLQAAARAALSEANCDLHVPGDAPVALAVGPLEARSDFHVLIKAWTRVARLWPLARLWLIGDGTRRERLFKQVHEAGLSGRVLMPGTFDDARGLLQAADLLVLPAATAGEPLVLLEAMAVGVPVVASDSPGHHQLVEDGVTGRLVAPGSSSRFAQAILEIFQDHRRAALMATAATQRVRQERSLSMMVERHVALFRELMASTARSNP